MGTRPFEKGIKTASKDPGPEDQALVSPQRSVQLRGLHECTKVEGRFAVNFTKPQRVMAHDRCYYIK